VRFAKSQGVAAAKAQTGVTAGRFDIANAAIKGRNEAIQAREVTGMLDAFDLQSKRDNRIAEHRLNNIGRSMSILPQLGRVPDLPTMPERPTGFTQNNNALWMDIAGSVVQGTLTALGGQGKAPGMIGESVSDFDTSGSAALGKAASQPQFTFGASQINTAFGADNLNKTFLD
jgi:hypothetical protein